MISFTGRKQLVKKSYPKEGLQPQVGPVASSFDSYVVSVFTG